MRADLFLIRYFNCVSYSRLVEIFYPLIESHSDEYNPLKHISCLLDRDGQLIVFNRFIESPDRELIAECFAKNQDGINWKNKKYLCLDQITVCECNREEIDKVLKRSTPSP